MRLRQSYSGYLLGRGGKTLAELKDMIDNGREPTKAMEDGALVDQLLYGGHTYCEAQVCVKRSGPDKGAQFEPEDWTSADAKEQRDAARSRGQVCALKHEVDLALRQKQSLLEALEAEGIDLFNEKMVTRCMGDPLVASQVFFSGPKRARVFTQPLILWRDAEGVECQGTLDILEVFADLSWRVVDTKLSARADEEWVSKQASDMGWDTQQGAYFDACVLGLNLDPEKFKGHALAVCEKRSKLSMSAVYWLEDIFLHCGQEQWRRCKSVWKDALEKDEWPGLLGGKLSPPGYYVSKLFDSVDSPGADDLSLVGLDTSGLETEE